MDTRARALRWYRVYLMVVLVAGAAAAVVVVIVAAAAAAMRVTLAVGVAAVFEQQCQAGDRTNTHTSVHSSKSRSSHVMSD